MVLKEFFVSLGLDTDAQSFARGQIAVEALKLGLNAFLRVAEKAFDFFKDLSVGTVEYGDNIQKTSQRIGISTDALQELNYAASLTAVSTEELNHGVGFLARNMADAARGGKEQARAFASAGVAVKDLHGNLRPAEDVLTDLADHFKTLPDGTTKTALSMQLFGRAGKQMIPLLNQGSEGLAKLRKEAHDFGVVLDKDSIEQSSQARENLERLSQAWKGIKLAIGAFLIGPISKAAAAVAKWLAEHRKLIASSIKDTFVAIGHAIELVWHGLQFTYELISKLVAAMGSWGDIAVAVGLAFAAAWVLAAAPIILIAALFALIVLVLDDIQTALEGGDSLIVRLWDKWSKFIDDWTKPRDGDGWLMLGLKALVHMIMHFGEAWDDAVAFWKEKFQEFFAWLEGKITWLSRKVNSIAHAAFGTIDISDAISSEAQKRDPKAYAAAMAQARATWNAGVDAYDPSAPIGVGGVASAASMMQNFAGGMPAGFGIGASVPGGAKVVTNKLDLSHMTIQASGDPKEIADTVTRKVDEHWNTKMREAGN